MKWIIFSLLLGIVEVWTIGQLHEILGTSLLIGLYVATTGLGATFLYMQLEKFREAMHAMKKLDTKWRKKTKDPSFKPNAEELRMLKPMVFVGIYVPALAFIVIPGLVSDIIGMILVFPIFGNWIIEYKMNKAIKNAQSD